MVKFLRRPVSDAMCEDKGTLPLDDSPTVENGGLSSALSNCKIKLEEKS